MRPSNNGDVKGIENEADDVQLPSSSSVQLVNSTSSEIRDDNIAFEGSKSALMTMNDQSTHDLFSMDWSAIVKVHDVAKQLRTFVDIVGESGGTITNEMNQLAQRAITIMEGDPTYESSKSETSEYALYKCLRHRELHELMIHLIQPSADEGLLQDIVPFYKEEMYLPLHAAIVNKHSLDVIEQLVLAYPESVRITDVNGKLPLHLAIEKNVDVNVVRFLIFASDDFLDKTDNELSSPLHYLAKAAKPNQKNMSSSRNIFDSEFKKLSSLIYLCIELGSDVEITNGEGCDFFDCYFDDTDSTYTIDEFIKDRPWSCILYTTDILKRSMEPLVILNRKVEDLLKYLEKKMELQDDSILFLLLNFHLSVKKAAAFHDAESRQLDEIADKIEACMIKVFDCSSLDEPHKLLMMLLSKDSFKKRDSLSSEGNNDLQSTFTRNSRTRQHRKKLLYKCECLRESNFLGSCLEENVKGVFACSQISRIMNDVMFGHLGKELGNDFKMFCPILYSIFLQNKLLMPSDAGDSSSSSAHSVQAMQTVLERSWFTYSQATLKTVMLYSINLRSCPLAMIILEGLSKCFAFIIVAYNAVYEIDERGNRTSVQLSPMQIVLVVHLIADIIYEIGQAEEEKWNLWNHFMGQWNLFDTAYIILTSIWAVSLWVNGGNIIDNADRRLNVGNICLALAAIPVSLSLLQYVSLKQETGALVIMIFSMFYDLFSFMLVFVVVMIGAATSFWSLFYGYDNFPNFSTTFITLFKTSLGQWDFSWFDTPDGMTPSHRSTEYKQVGIGLLIIYIIITSIMLLNLLIARMSNTHQRISDHALQEWSFIKASTVRQFVLLNARSPLCMLPPPFNLLSAPLYLIDLFWLRSDKKKISMADTFSNAFLSFTFGGLLRFLAIMTHSFPRNAIFEIFVSSRSRWSTWYSRLGAFLLLLLWPAIFILRLLDAVFAVVVTPFLFLNHAIVRVERRKNGLFEIDWFDDQAGFGAGKASTESGGKATLGREEMIQAKYKSMRHSSSGDVNDSQKTLSNASSSKKAQLSTSLSLSSSSSTSSSFSSQKKYQQSRIVPTNHSIQEDSDMPAPTPSSIKTSSTSKLKSQMTNEDVMMTQKEFFTVRPLDSSIRGQSSIAAFLLENIRDALDLTEASFEDKFANPAFAAQISTSISYVKRSMTWSDSKKVAESISKMNKLHGEHEALDHLPGPERNNENNEIFKSSDISNILGSLKEYYNIEADATSDSSANAQIITDTLAALQSELSDIKKQLQTLMPK